MKRPIPKPKLKAGDTVRVKKTGKESTIDSVIYTTDSVYPYKYEYFGLQKRYDEHHFEFVSPAPY